LYRSSGRVNNPILSNNLPKAFFTNKNHENKKQITEQEKSDSIKVSEKSDSMRSSDKSDSIKEKSENKVDKNEINKPPMPHKRAIKTLNPYNVNNSNYNSKEKEKE